MAARKRTSTITEKTIKNSSKSNKRGYCNSEYNLAYMYKLLLYELRKQIVIQFSRFPDGLDNDFKNRGI